MTTLPHISWPAWKLKELRDDMGQPAALRSKANELLKLYEVKPSCTSFDITEFGSAL